MTDDTTHSQLARLEAIAPAARAAESHSEKTAAAESLREVYRRLVRAGWPMLVAREMMDHVLNGGSVDSWMRAQALRASLASATTSEDDGGTAPDGGDANEASDDVAKASGAPSSSDDAHERWARHRALARAHVTTRDPGSTGWTWVGAGASSDDDEGASLADDAAFDDESGPWPYPFERDAFDEHDVVEHVFRERNEWTIELAERLADVWDVRVWREPRERWSTLHVEAAWHTLRGYLADHARLAWDIEDRISEWLDDLLDD